MLYNIGLYDSMVVVVQTVQTVRPIFQLTTSRRLPRGPLLQRHSLFYYNPASCFHIFEAFLSAIEDALEIHHATPLRPSVYLVVMAKRRNEVNTSN